MYRDIDASGGGTQETVGRDLPGLGEDGRRGAGRGDACMHACVPAGARWGVLGRADGTNGSFCIEHENAMASEPRDPPPPPASTPRRGYVR